MLVNIALFKIMLLFGVTLFGSTVPNLIIDIRLLALFSPEMKFLCRGIYKHLNL